MRESIALWPNQTRLREVRKLLRLRALLIELLTQKKLQEIITQTE